MLTADTIGMVAGALTSAAFVPQVWRVMKTRHTADISLSMYLIFVIGVALWCAFGFLIHSIPVVLYNIITLLLAGAVLVMKLRFG